MTGAACQRHWEAEASRDGRLSGEERARFEEHCERCVTCEARRLELEALAAALQRSMPDGLDPLSLRRLRQRILKSADASLTRSPGRQERRAGALRAFGFVILGLAALVGIGQLASRRAAPMSVVASTSVAAVAVGDAVWAERGSAGARRFVLESGTLRLAITRVPGDRPVVLEVPDGEIEDEGTTFSVSVERRHTASIHVEAGAVIFRRPGNGAVRVLAGQSWRSSEGAAPEAERSAVAPADILPAIPGPAGPVLRARSSRAIPPAGGRRGPSATATASTVIEAEEDLQYLRIVALQHEGRGGEASLAAREYLQRFPAAFRRVEVERIARRH